MAPINTNKPQDIITPAEMKFWDEWAQKSPALVRNADTQLAQEIPQGGKPGLKAATIGLGVALGIASLTRAVPGRWKWVSGTAAVGSAALGIYADRQSKQAENKARSALPQLKESFASYAAALEQNPDLRKMLAEYLSNTVTAQEIQAFGIQDAVTARTLEFGFDTPYMEGSKVRRLAALAVSTAKAGPAGTFRG